MCTLFPAYSQFENTHFPVFYRIYVITWLAVGLSWFASVVALIQQTMADDVTKINKVYIGHIETERVCIQVVTATLTFKVTWGRQNPMFH